MNVNTKRRLAGQGTVIVIAALFILVMACMQIAQSFLLTQVGDQTTRSGLGRMSALVVESAVEEARVLMAVRVNSPSDPLFEKIRRTGPTLEPGKPVDKVTFKPADLPRLARILAGETGKNVEVLEVSCEVQAGRPLAAGYPYDTDGVLVYRARARATIDRSIVRELEETQGFKLTQLALPAPLTKFPLVIRDPYRMLFGRRSADPPGGADLNELRKRIVDEHIPQLKTRYQDFMRRLDDAIAQDLPPFAPDEAKRMKQFAQRVRPAYAKVSSDNNRDHIALAEAAGRDVREFPAAPNELALYMLIAQVDPIDLEKVNVQWRYAQKQPTLKGVIDEIDRLGAQTQAMLDAKDTSEPAYQANVRFSEKMIEELDLLAEVLGYIQSVQLGLKTVERSANAQGYDYLLAVVAAFDPWQLGGGFSSLAQRASYRITEETGPGAVSVQEQWNRLRKRLDAFGGGFSGVVYVDNRNEVFRLEGEYAGQLVVAIAGKAILENLRPRAARDTMTVVVRGGDGGAVQLRGALTASICTRGSALNIDPGTSITGTLVLDEIPFSLQRGLTGTVVVDPRLADTSRPAFWYVGLSPWVRSRTTVRS